LGSRPSWSTSHPMAGAGIFYNELGRPEYYSGAEGDIMHVGGQPATPALFKVPWPSQEVTVWRTDCHNGLAASRRVRPEDRLRA